MMRDTVNSLLSSLLSGRRQGFFASTHKIRQNPTHRDLGGPRRVPRRVGGIRLRDLPRKSPGPGKTSLSLSAGRRDSLDECSLDKEEQDDDRHGEDGGGRHQQRPLATVSAQELLQAVRRPASTPRGDGPPHPVRFDSANSACKPARLTPHDHKRRRTPCPTSTKTGRVWDAVRV